MNSRKPGFVKCERCGKFIVEYDEKWTCDTLGYELRSVCPDCYDDVMKNGYDSEVCGYEDAEYAEYRHEQKICI